MTLWWWYSAYCVTVFVFCFFMRNLSISRCLKRSRIVLRCFPLILWRLTLSVTVVFYSLPAWVLARQEKMFVSCKSVPESGESLCVSFTFGSHWCGCLGCLGWLHIVQHGTGEGTDGSDNESFLRFSFTFYILYILYSIRIQCSHICGCIWMREIVLVSSSSSTFSHSVNF